MPCRGTGEINRCLEKETFLQEALRRATAGGEERAGIANSAKKIVGQEEDEEGCGIG